VDSARRRGGGRLISGRGFRPVILPCSLSSNLNVKGDRERGWRRSRLRVSPKTRRPRLCAASH
jgi:hypothetical protein